MASLDRLRVLAGEQDPISANPSIDRLRALAGESTSGATGFNPITGSEVPGLKPWDGVPLSDRAQGEVRQLMQAHPKWNLSRVADELKPHHPDWHPQALQGAYNGIRNETATPYAKVMKFLEGVGAAVGAAAGTGPGYMGPVVKPAGPSDGSTLDMSSSVSAFPETRPSIQIPNEQAAMVGQLTTRAEQTIAEITPDKPSIPKWVKKLASDPDEVQKLTNMTTFHAAQYAEVLDGLRKGKREFEIYPSFPEVVSTSVAVFQGESSMGPRWETRRFKNAQEARDFFSEVSKIDKAVEQELGVNLTGGLWIPYEGEEVDPVAAAWTRWPAMGMGMIASGAAFGGLSAGWQALKATKAVAAVNSTKAGGAVIGSMEGVGKLREGVYNALGTGGVLARTGKGAAAGAIEGNIYNALITGANALTYDFTAEEFTERLKGGALAGTVMGAGLGAVGGMARGRGGSDAPAGERPAREPLTLNAKRGSNVTELGTQNQLDINRATHSPRDYAPVDTSIFEGEGLSREAVAAARNPRPEQVSSIEYTRPEPPKAVEDMSRRERKSWRQQRALELGYTETETAAIQPDVMTELLRRDVPAAQVSQIHEDGSITAKGRKGGEYKIDRPVGTPAPIREKPYADVGDGPVIAEGQPRQEAPVVAGQQGQEPGSTTARRLPTPPKPIPGQDRAIADTPGVIESMSDGTARMQTSAIGADPERFQFKLDVDKTGAGTALKGVKKWNPDLEGVLLVWRDPKDGKVYVVNGHHRLELAKRLKVPNLRVKFIEAADAPGARAKGALTNIAEGRGTATDVAKFLRDTGRTGTDLEAAGVSVRERLVQDGTALANLSPDLWRKVYRKEMPERRGVIIGRELADHADQAALSKFLSQKDGRLTDAELEELVRFTKSAPRETSVTESMFGPEEITKNLAVDKARLSAYIKSRLSTDKSLFKFVSRRGRAEALAKGNNVIDAAKSGQLAGEAERLLEAYDKLSAYSGPVSDALNDAASRIAKGESPNAVREDLYDNIGRSIRGGIVPGGESGPVGTDVGGTARVPGSGAPAPEGPGGEQRVPESGRVEPASDSEPAAASSWQDLKKKITGEVNDANPEQDLPTPGGLTIQYVKKPSSPPKAETTVLDRLNAREAEVKARIKAGQNAEPGKGIGDLFNNERGSVPVDPFNIRDYAELGAIKIAKGAVKFADWSKQMVDEFGTWIDPHLKKIWKLAQKHHEDVVAPMVEEIQTLGKENPVGALNRAILGAQPVWENVESVRHTEMKRRTAKAMGTAASVREKGGSPQEILNAMRGSYKGEMPGKDFAPLDLSAEHVAALKQQIIDTDRIPETHTLTRIQASDALDKLLSGEVPTPSDQVILARVFGPEIIANIQEATGLSRADSLHAYFYGNMLSSIGTHIVNFGSNATWALQNLVMRPADAAVDAMISKATGRPRTRYLRETAPAAVGMWEGMPGGLRRAAFVMENGFDANAISSLDLPQGVELKFWKGNWGPVKFRGKTLTPVIPKNPWNGIKRLMVAGDVMFKEMARESDLMASAARQAIGGGLKGDALMKRAREIRADATPKMLNHADEFAQYSTFQQEGDAVTKLFLQARDMRIPSRIPGVGGIQPGRLIVPFVQVGVNMLKIGAEYSPAGFLQMFDPAIRRSPELAQVIARAAVGSLTMAGISALVENGTIQLTGRAPTTPGERDLFYQEGKQPYAVKVGDKWIPYQRLGPMGYPLAVVAALHNAMVEDGEEPTVGRVINGLMEIVAYTADQSYFQGLNTFMQAVEDPQRFGQQLLSGVASQAVPLSSMMRNVTQATDPVVRNIESVYDRLRSQIPGASRTLDPKLTSFGKPSMRGSKRGFSAFWPFSASYENTDPVVVELSRLHVIPGYVGRTLTLGDQKSRLTDEQWQKYQTMAGEGAYEGLTELVTSSDYADMPDEEKEEALSDAIRMTRDDARDAFKAEESGSITYR